jgi:hypothetical protein
MADIAEIDPLFTPLTPHTIAPLAMVSAPDDGELVLPVPADASPIPDAHFKLGRPTQQWRYCDPARAVLFLILRFDKIDGGKEFWPLTLWRAAQGLRWRWKSVPAPALQARRTGRAARRCGAGVRG